MTHIGKTALSLLVAVCTMIPAKSQIAYKIEGNGLKEPAVIFGTHHLAPLSVIDSVKGAREAFDEASRIVGEIDMTQGPMQIQMAMQQHIAAPADSTLHDLLPAAKWNALNESFKSLAPMPGMDLELLNGMKPMAVTTIVALGIVSKEMPDYNPAEQLDSYFQTEGAKAGKKIIGLETVDEQATLLYDFTPVAEQAEALVKVLENPSEEMKSAREMNEAYAAQELDRLVALSEAQSANAAFMKALVNDRNAAWAEKLPAIMAEGPVFVAVGALHLSGENGLLKMLENKGYKVTPLK